MHHLLAHYLPVQCICQDVLFLGLHLSFSTAFHTRKAICSKLYKSNAVCNCFDSTMPWLSINRILLSWFKVAPPSAGPNAWNTSSWLYFNKKGVPSAVGFPHCAGSGEGLSLSPKPYPHKCAEAVYTCFSVRHCTEGGSIWLSCASFSHIIYPMSQEISIVILPDVSPLQ